MTTFFKGLALASVAGFALLLIPATTTQARDKDDYWDNYWDTHWQGYRNKNHRYFYGTPYNAHNPYYGAYPSSFYMGYPNQFYNRTPHNHYGRANNMLY